MLGQRISLALLSVAGLASALPTEKSEINEALLKRAIEARADKQCESASLLQSNLALGLLLNEYAGEELPFSVYLIAVHFVERLNSCGYEVTLDDVFGLGDPQVGGLVPDTPTDGGDIVPDTPGEGGAIVPDTPADGGSLEPDTTNSDGVNLSAEKRSIDWATLPTAGLGDGRGRLPIADFPAGALPTVNFATVTKRSLPVVALPTDALAFEDSLPAESLSSIDLPTGTLPAIDLGVPTGGAMIPGKRAEAEFSLLPGAETTLTPEIPIEGGELVPDIPIDSGLEPGTEVEGGELIPAEPIDSEIGTGTVVDGGELEPSTKTKRTCDSVLVGRLTSLEATQGKCGYKNGKTDPIAYSEQLSIVLALYYRCGTVWSGWIAVELEGGIITMGPLNTPKPDTEPEPEPPATTTKTKTTKPATTHTPLPPTEDPKPTTTHTPLPPTKDPKPTSTYTPLPPTEDPKPTPEPYPEPEPTTTTKTTKTSPPPAPTPTIVNPNPECGKAEVLLISLEASQGKCGYKNGSTNIAAYNEQLSIVTALYHTCGVTWDGWMVVDLNGGTVSMGPISTTYQIY